MTDTIITAVLVLIGLPIGVLLWLIVIGSICVLWDDIQESIRK